MKDRLIALIIGYTGSCMCDEAYSGRNLLDPQCVYHFIGVEDLAADIEKEVMPNVQ